MDSMQLWSIKVKGKDGAPQCIWDLCYSPDGTKLIAAADCIVLVYRSDDGELQKSLKGHKDIIYCVDWSHDGKYFSSGAADNFVIVWKATTLDALVKFKHNDAIQCLAFNPATNLLASCACTDFAFWTSESKTLVRTKLQARATCCSWKSDGQYLAIGLFNGTISIRNKTSDEIARIERPGSPIIWKLKWSPSNTELRELLAVIDWNQKLAFYQLCGKQTGKDRNLSFDPCDLSWFGAKSEALVICGSDQTCSMYSAEGNRLTTVNKQNSWIWCCHTRPGENQIAVGCQDGTIETTQLLLPTVHSLYRDRYAYRESLTDVVVQHLTTQQKDKILVYEPTTDEPTDMHYRVREKLNRDIECQLLVVTTHNFIICQDNRLTSLNFQGVKEREWILDGAVRYIRICGGSATRETLLVGLKSGQAIKIILDNAFAIQLVQILGGIRCVDISRSHDKLGVIDDNSTLSVFCLKTKELLFQEPSVISLAWSTTNNELLSFSGKDIIFIKAGQFPSYSQYCKGVTVGFTGSFIYCLQENLIKRVEIYLATAMYSYLEAGHFDEARQVACHGLTDPDWTALGQAALKKLNLTVSKNAYMQLRDTVMLTFIQQLEDRRRRSEWSDQDTTPNPSTLLAMGDVAAYLGNFSEAVTLYHRAGASAGGAQRVVELYTDLRRFDDAREAMTASGDTDAQRQLITKHADWAKSTNEHRVATKMYMDAGEYAKAIELAGEHNWVDVLLDISRRLDKGDRDCLELCAQQLARLNEYAFAADCYAKYGDVENQVALYVEARSWEEAFSLTEKHPEYVSQVYLPYAQWLAENDKFEEAQVAFAKAGFQSDAVRVLEQLAICAANECRFEDAGFYHWKLSMQCLDMARATLDVKEQNILLHKFHDLLRKADVYYVYSNIHRYLHEPFASQMPETYFNMSRYLMGVLRTDDVNSVYKVAVLYTLAKHGCSLGAYKTARSVYDRLKSLHLPHKMRETVEMATLCIRTKPMTDTDDINAMCYRCSTTNPLWNNAGNQCTNCGEPFVYSFISLEQLPLVEFVPEKGISHAQVLEYLKVDPSAYKMHADRAAPIDRHMDRGATQTLTISNGVGDSMDEHDPFTAKLINTDIGPGSYSPVQLDAETLRAIPASEVIVMELEAPLRPRYFKSVLSEVNITQCGTCHKLFNTDDYELAILQKTHCPFCRTPRE